MPAPGISSFDGNPNTSPPTVNGYRPGPQDFNGAQLQDDPVNVPDPQTMPTSALLNTDSLQLVSLSRMIEVGAIGVNAGASPSTAWWFTAANNIQLNPFSILRSAQGIYQITYAAGLLPVQGWPRAWLNVALGAHNYAISVLPISNGATVYTVQDAVLTDLAFSLAFF